MYNVYLSNIVPHFEDGCLPHFSRVLHAVIFFLTHSQHLKVVNSTALDSETCQKWSLRSTETMKCNLLNQEFNTHVHVFLSFPEVTL